MGVICCCFAYIDTASNPHETASCQGTNSSNTNPEKLDLGHDGRGRQLSSFVK